jgi:8-oxo-dGTP pyrophosphatase MutT (NUDIX family)
VTLLLTAEQDDFRARAKRLRPEPPAFLHVEARGDHSLDRLASPADAAPPRPAAVLVPIVMHAAGPSILLTERATGLRTHSGQIAFPGGRMDDTDATPTETALREAEEEIGLDRRHVEPLGYLDPYLSSSNYFVIPAVALVSPAHDLRLNPHEVADVFEVPLGFLMDEINHELHCREWRGGIRQYYAMPFGRRYIWGVTAGILRNMYERLYAASRDPGLL